MPDSPTWREVRELTRTAAALKPSKVVRPNRWDDREARLEDICVALLRTTRELHPEDFDPKRLRTLDFCVAVKRAEQELAKPHRADLDGNVRAWPVRLWREHRTRQYRRTR